MSKPEQAQALLSDQRRRLENAIRIYSSDPLDICFLNDCRAQLRRVASWEADMTRDAEFFAPLVLGFMGPNGWGPLIDLLCRQAEEAEAKRDHMLEAAE